MITTVFLYKWVSPVIIRTLHKLHICAIQPRSTCLLFECMFDNLVPKAQLENNKAKEKKNEIRKDSKPLEVKSNVNLTSSHAIAYV